MCLHSNPISPCPLNLNRWPHRSTLQAETRVTKLLHPHDSDIVVAITRDRSLVVWRHSTASAYRVFKARAAW